jgi:8-oxo-dGTP diphosphatase
MENGKKVYRACKAIVFSGGKILLLRNNPAGFELGHRPELGEWDIPGGRMEPGESEEQTLRREVLEETGLNAEVGRFVSDFEFSPRDDVVIRGRCYVCSVSSREIALKPEGQHDTALWLTLDEAIERDIPAWLRAGIERLRELGDARNYL